ncbi:MAG: hypothetical protein WB992_14195 [Bryobacteraceae bacterium]
MLKRVGLYALMLAGSLAFLQPTAAFAQEWSNRGAYHNSGNRGNGFRNDREFRGNYRANDRNWGWRGNEWRGRGYNRAYYYGPARGYYYGAPNAYYAPAPGCTCGY